ncbi:MAG TPA: ABC transporter permease, partial [Acidimicrobiia bacterium]|nr:ABC transporter permease [Acidimicrobiia bacterium]
MRDWAAKHRWESILIVVLAATIVVNVSLSPFYLGFGNFVNLFWLSIEKIIVVVVMTFVIINGEIDLSVASVMGFSAAVMATLYEGGELPFALAILIGIAVGAIAGLLQGLVITRFGLPSLVVTLAGLIGFRGAARVLLEDRSVGDFPEWFESIGQQTLVGPFPFALVLFFVGLALAWVILERSAFGRKVYVIGNSADVARFSGIEVDSVKVRLFVSSGAVAGLAGILFAARVGAVQGTLGETYELDIITMVLLGGVSIFGGSGSMLGVVLAMFTVLNIRNG